MSDPSPMQDHLPSHIGPFRIAGVLGEGAMGRVYLAEQDEPRREVALKVMRTAGATGRDLARFRREVELLAELEHPGIARIYASGSADTASGSVPWLAMECVRGKNLVEHAEAAGLDAEQRLRLLAELCRTVHFAHSRGVIHRDLKPSNLLVDASGQVKVLDFGIARALWNEGDTEMTQAGQVLGTLPYMSWEQLRGEAGAVDPRSDVYALGVIGYQLLAGQLPYPALSEATLVGALEQRRMHEPLPLSRLLPSARGDLEVIVMKALAHDAAARYASAADLAADLERFLGHQPIAAQPPTAMYLARLFVRRHRTLSLAAAAVLAAILAGAAVSLSYAISERRAREESETVSHFLETMLTSADPEKSLGKLLTLRDVLAGARRSLDGDRSLPPGVSLQLHRAIGLSYLGLNEFKDAGSLLTRARAQAVDLDGADSPRIRELDLRLAIAEEADGQTEPARQRLQALLARLDGDDARSARLRAEARLALADLRIHAGEFEGLADLLTGWIADATQALGGRDRSTLFLQQKLAEAHFMTGALDRSAELAEALVRDAGAALGEDDTLTLAARFHVASCRNEQQRYGDAEAQFRDIIERRRRIYGNDHPATLETQSVLALTLRNAERSAEAEPLVRESFDKLRARLDPEDIRIGFARDTLATVLEDVGKAAEAEQIYRERIASLERSAGGPTLHDVATYYHLAFLLTNGGRLDEARPAWLRTVELARKLMPAGSYDIARIESAYGECLIRRKDWAEARQLLEPALAVMVAQLGWEHGLSQKTLKRLAVVHRAQGEPEKAVVLEKHLPPAKAAAP